MSKHIPIGLFKGIDIYGMPGSISFFYNDGSKEYGWYQWGLQTCWDREKQEEVRNEGWFVPSVVRPATFIPSSEFEFLVLTGKEFKVPNGT